MRAVIVGDLHFGARGNSLKFLDFQTKWFKEELLTFIKKNEIDTAIFLGDVFDSRNSISPVVNTQVRDLFKKLMKHVKSAHCILGNHDIFFRNKKNIHSLTVLEDQGVNIYENPTEVKFGNLKCLMLPWIVKDEMADVQKLLAHNDYDICFGHLEINSFEKVKGVQEDDGFQCDLFANCKKVISGHFHLRRQHGNIIYVGTPYELTWNDYLDEKGLHVLDGNGDVEYTPSNNTPKHTIISNKQISIEKLTKARISSNFIKVKFDKVISEVDKINYIEKINSLEPLFFMVDDDLAFDLESDENIEADVKDTLGFLHEYVNLIEIPENIDRKLLMEKLEDIYNEVI